MRLEEAEKLVKYGSSINVLVTPKIIDGEIWVSYRDHETPDSKRAHRDLLQFTCEMVEAA